MKNRMYQAMKEAIMAHKRWKGKDIYAAMILVEWNVMGDVLDVMINCNRDQFMNMGPLNLEERWEYSYWSERNEINIVPDIISDRDVEKWLYEHGVEQIGEPIKKGEPLVYGTQEVLAMLKDTALLLMADEEITSRIGKNTPILIHETEYFEPYISANLEINEGKNIKSYRKWIEC